MLKDKREKKKKTFIYTTAYIDIMFVNSIVI